MSWQLVASGYALSLAWVLADFANWTAPLHRWKSHRPEYEAMLWDLFGMVAKLFLGICMLFSIAQAARWGIAAALFVCLSYGLAVFTGMKLHK